MDIDISKLTRVYNNEIIYFNEYVYEILNDTTNLKIHKWRDLDINNISVGDYIIADDDYVLRILNIRQYNDVYFIKLPNVQVTLRIYKGKYYYSKLLGGYTGLNNTRGANSKYDNNNMEIKKKVFAELISNGLHPYNAYRTAFKNKRIMASGTLNSKILNLLKDKEVIKILKENKMELEDKIKEAFSDERMVTELMDLLARSRKGSDAHRENIKFVLALLNKLPDTMVNKKLKSVNNIELTPFEEVQPPKLIDM